jgi:SNF2 family DNA or RNA helicase
LFLLKGINLTAADTCIIFDSDWNPQNDLQAQARCHRIGQTKNVKVYRLLTRKTYEMQMFHMSSLKMGLDQAVLQGIENGGSSTGSEVSHLINKTYEKRFATLNTFNLHFVDAVKRGSRKAFTPWCLRHFP